MNSEPSQPSGRAADLGFWVSSSDLTYWLSHPSVDTALLTPAVKDGEPCGADLQIWLKPGSAVADCADCAEDGEDPKRPARQPEIELFGEGYDPDVNFLARCPRLDHFEFSIEGASDEVYPRGWWAARLWIAPEN